MPQGTSARKPHLLPCGGVRRTDTQREGTQMKKAEYGILDVIAHVSVMATLAIVIAVF